MNSSQINRQTNREFLTALPVFNEVTHLDEVLDLVKQYSPEILVVDDGSTDGTSEELKKYQDQPGMHIVTHEQNQGYGAALHTAFRYAIEHGYEYLVTIDCDGQHEPQRISEFVTAAKATNADIISGSRYLKQFESDKTPPPEERKRINHLITAELNRRLGIELTDAFCGFKAYRVSCLSEMDMTEVGYAMPLEVWAQAARIGCKIVELPVPLIYLDENRSFGGALDDGSTRLQYYHLVIDRSLAAVEAAYHSIDLAAGVPCSPCGESSS